VRLGWWVVLLSRCGFCAPRRGSFELVVAPAVKDAGPLLPRRALGLGVLQVAGEPLAAATF